MAIAKIKLAGSAIIDIAHKRTLGKTIVFTNGCFDILHPGHVDLLEQAKSFGDILVVGLNSDESVRSLNKGNDRPIRNQNDRASMLSALWAVDYVIIFDDSTPEMLISQLKPDILVKGSDYSADKLAGRSIIEKYGGQVRIVPITSGFSTTSELAKIRSTPCAL